MTYPELISINLPHLTESQICLPPCRREWKAYGHIYPWFLYKTEHSYAIDLNKLLIDSAHIARLGDLKRDFGSLKKGRAIRQDDMVFNLAKVKKQTVVIPEHEFCRHHDGCMHASHKAPLLFIPNGFLMGISIFDMAMPLPKRLYSHKSIIRKI